MDRSMCFGFLLVFALAFCSCTTSLKYPATISLQTKGRTPLTVAVPDFVDHNDGEHGMLWDGAWSYGEDVSTAVADLVAAKLLDTGLFDRVERVSTAILEGFEGFKGYDLIVAGDIQEFKTGFAPHPTVFINPICLPALVGIPTAYGFEEGKSTISLKILDVRSRQNIQSISFSSKFKPALVWAGQITAWGDRNRRGKCQLEAIANDLTSILSGKLASGFEKKIIALNQDRGYISEIPTMASLPHPALAEKPLMVGNRWAVVVGISEYKNSGRGGLGNLVFADDDAKAFVKSLQNIGWSSSHIKLLVNENATQRNIMIVLESWLSKAGQNDQIILFWAGHGFPDPEDPEKVYFACYDTDINIPATGYRMDQVRKSLEEKQARNVVLLADTCHAGKLITRGVDSRGVFLAKIKEQTVPKGWIFMVGADTDRQAIEHSSWTNGAFTHSLIKGLNGEADGFQSAGAKDGIITMGELKDFMRASMPDETQQVLGVAKHPVITTNSGDPDIWNLSLQVNQ